MNQVKHDKDCHSDGTDYYGRCLGQCRECGEHLQSTGRYTVYCPSCDCCEECGCPACDGFEHFSGCKLRTDMDYSFTSQTDGADILDTTISGMEVEDSK